METAAQAARRRNTRPVPNTGGMARFIRAHTMAHADAAMMSFIRSATTALKPRCPKRLFSRISMVTMPVQPAMEVARARPRAPRKILRIRFSTMLTETTRQLTRKGVRVSWRAWNTRLKKSRSPKKGTPTT